MSQDEKRNWRLPTIVDIGAVFDVTDGSDSNVTDNHPNVPVFYDPKTKNIDGEVDLGDR